MTSRIIRFEFLGSATLTEHAKIEQFRQTCDGIRRMHDARKQVIDEMSAALETIIREWQTLTNLALNETNLSRRRELRHQQSQLINRRDDLRAEIARRQRKLNEYQNDFELNGCPALVQPL